MRPLAWGASFALDKMFDSDIQFFTIGLSLIGGPDPIRPSNNDVIQEWDKYVFTDYSDRLIDIEWVREVEDVSSVTMAIADIVLDNHDDYFTPNTGSPIDEYILPARPVRLFAGFGNEKISQFIGLTEGMPKANEKDKTVTFHCIDFMSALLSRDIGDTALLENKRVDEILSTLFLGVGVLGSQMNLDVAVVTVPLAYFRRGQKLKDAVIKLMEVEQGRLYMDENGVITFKNRNNYNAGAIYNFDGHNIIDMETRKEDQIINSVEITGQRREIQANAQYWSTQEAIRVPANESVTVWADFQDPVASVDEPEIVGSTSAFVVNTQADGGGSNNTTDVTLDSFNLFGTAYKMVFQNSSGNDLYITSISLYAQVASVTSEIFVREELTESINKYEEKSLSIENDFFQTEADATALAESILESYGELGSLSEMSVKGNMALQLDDVISVNLPKLVGNYRIMRISNRISLPAKFTQILRVKKFE